MSSSTFDQKTTPTSTPMSSLSSLSSAGAAVSAPVTYTIEYDDDFKTIRTNIIASVEIRGENRLLIFSNHAEATKARNAISALFSNDDTGEISQQEKEDITEDIAEDAKSFELTAKQVKFIEEQSNLVVENIKRELEEKKEEEELKLQQQNAEKKEPEDKESKEAKTEKKFFNAPKTEKERKENTDKIRQRMHAFYKKGTDDSSSSSAEIMQQLVDDEEFDEIQTEDDDPQLQLAITNSLQAVHTGATRRPDSKPAASSSSSSSSSSARTSESADAKDLYLTIERMQNKAQPIDSCILFNDFLYIKDSEHSFPRDAYLGINQRYDEDILVPTIKVHDCALLDFRAFGIHSDIALLNKVTEIRNRLKKNVELNLIEFVNNELIDKFAQLIQSLKNTFFHDNYLITQLYDLLQTLNKIIKDGLNNTRSLTTTDFLGAEILLAFKHNAAFAKMQLTRDEFHVSLKTLTIIYNFVFHTMNDSLVSLLELSDHLDTIKCQRYVLSILSAVRGLNVWKIKDDKERELKINDCIIQTFENLAATDFINKILENKYHNKSKSYYLERIYNKTIYKSPTKIAAILYLLAKNKYLTKIPEKWLNAVLTSLSQMPLSSLIKVLDEHIHNRAHFVELFNGSLSAETIQNRTRTFIFFDLSHDEFFEDYGLHLRALMLKPYCHKIAEGSWFVSTNPSTSTKIRIKYEECIADLKMQPFAAEIACALMEMDRYAGYFNDENITILLRHVQVAARIAKLLFFGDLTLSTLHIFGKISFEDICHRAYSDIFLNTVILIKNSMDHHSEQIMELNEIYLATYREMNSCNERVVQNRIYTIMSSAVFSINLIVGRDLVYYILQNVHFYTISESNMEIFDEQFKVCMAKCSANKNMDIDGVLERLRLPEIFRYAVKYSIILEQFKTAISNFGISAYVPQVQSALGCASKYFDLSSGPGYLVREYLFFPQAKAKSKIAEWTKLLNHFFNIAPPGDMTPTPNESAIIKFLDNNPKIRLPMTFVNPPTGQKIYLPAHYFLNTQLSIKLGVRAYYDYVESLREYAPSSSERRIRLKN